MENWLAKFAAAEWGVCLAAFVACVVIGQIVLWLWGDHNG